MCLDNETVLTGNDAAFVIDGLWHVLQTKSRQEKRLASSLAAMEIPHFFAPAAEHSHLWPAKTDRRAASLFPDTCLSGGHWRMLIGPTAPGAWPK